MTLTKTNPIDVFKKVFVLEVFSIGCINSIFVDVQCQMPWIKNRLISNNESDRFDEVSQVVCYFIKEFPCVWYIWVIEFSYVFDGWIVLYFDDAFLVSLFILRTDCEYRKLCQVRAENIRWMVKIEGIIISKLNLCATFAFQLL